MTIENHSYSNTDNRNRSNNSSAPFSSSTSNKSDSRVMQAPEFQVCVPILCNWWPLRALGHYEVEAQSAPKD